MHGIARASVFWALWLVLLGLKLAVAAWLPLFGDEAWYWLEGRHLAWAYSDLPGLTAWLTRTGAELLGQNRLGVRAPFVLLSMIIPLLIAATARRWFGAGAGWLAGSGALLFPLLGSLGFLALPDVPLTFAAAACLYALARLRDGVEWRGLTWLALGLALGALSHYRFALLLFAGAIAMLADAPLRARMRDPRVLAVLAFGALAWWPLLHWNLQHAGAGFGFQLGERHPWRLHAGGAWFPLAQAAIASPVLLLVLIAVWTQAWSRWRQRTPGPWIVIVLAAAVPLAMYGVLGFVADRDRVSFHWTLQAYLPLLAGLPLVWVRLRSGLRFAAVFLAATLQLMVFAHVLVAANPAWRQALAESRWYPDNFAGWDELAQIVRADPTLRERRLHADNFMLGAQLAFALDAPTLSILDHPLNRKHGRSVQLEVWNHPGSPVPGDVLVVEDSAVAPRARLQRYRELCRDHGALESPQVVNVDHGRKRFLLFRLPSREATHCVLPALAWIDAPARGARVSGSFQVDGWAFKDGAGVDRVEIVLDGKVVATATYGLPRPHVAEYWRESADPAHPLVGFNATVDVSGMPPGVRWLGLVVHGRDGSREPWPEQRIVIH